MTNYLDFSGKCAAITGGRRGLGRAMALALAERGAQVAIISHSPEATELLQEIQNLGGRAHYFQADLGRREERSGLLAKVADQLGGLDILVNNAGFQFQESIETCTLEQWDASRSTLLDAVFELSQQAVPFMKQRGGGKIIHISSICAFREAGYTFSYGVMKGALVSLTRCMANSLAQANINVNAIAPGIIRTDLTARCFTEPEINRQQSAKYPTRRLGEPEDIAGVMLFLASELSHFVHGQTIIVDGGFTGN